MGVLVLTRDINFAGDIFNGDMPYGLQLVQFPDKKDGTRVGCPTHPHWPTWGTMGGMHW